MRLDPTLRVPSVTVSYRPCGSARPAAPRGPRPRSRLATDWRAACDGGCGSDNVLRQVRCASRAERGLLRQVRDTGPDAGGAVAAGLQVRAGASDLPDGGAAGEARWR